MIIKILNYLSHKSILIRKMYQCKIQIKYFSIMAAQDLRVMAPTC